MTENQLPATCPKCGSPRDLDCGNEASFLCGTWLLSDFTPVQSGECKVRVELATLTRERDELRGRLEEISQVWKRVVPLHEDILAIINRSTP